MPAAMAKAKTRMGLRSLVLSEMMELKYIWGGERTSGHRHPLPFPPATQGSAGHKQP